MNTENTSEYFETLKQQISAAPEGVDISKLLEMLESIENPPEERVKIWFLLDRSGSMSHLASDVIGGFNQFVTDQVNKPGEASLTAVQFDGDDPFEVIYDAKALEEVSELTSSTYWARGVTPLYDALGHLIETADKRIAERSDGGEPVEDQLVLVFTDGLENASVRFERSSIFKMIKERMNKDWTFVFMGANQDSYAEGGRIGLVDGNVQNYAMTPSSIGDAFGSMSRATSDYRGKSRARRVSEKERFFGDVKEAEEALKNSKE